MSDTKISVGIGAVALTVGLGVGTLVGGDAPELPALESTKAVIAPPREERPAVAITLLACGEMRGDDGARVDGTADGGMVRVGPGAGGACTIVFDKPWRSNFVCVVSSGGIARLTQTDLVVEQITASPFTFSCEVVR